MKTKHENTNFLLQPSGNPHSKTLNEFSEAKKIGNHLQCKRYLRHYLTASRKVTGETELPSFKRSAAIFPKNYAQIPSWAFHEAHWFALDYAFWIKF